jgi:hypothetical protein
MKQNLRRSVLGTNYVFTEEYIAENNASVFSLVSINITVSVPKIVPTI